MFPKNGSMIRRLAFLHWLQQGEVRQLQRYYQDAMTSYCSSRRTSFPSLGDTSVALVGFAPWRTSAPPRPGVGNPVSPSGCCRGSNRISQVPGEPQSSVCTCSKPTPAGLLAPDHLVQQRGPWSSKGKGSHDWVFRRSIAWLSDSLSTLRSAGLLQPHARLASSCWSGFTGRGSRPQGSDERFQRCDLHLIPLSQACLAQSMQPQRPTRRLFWSRSCTPP